MNAEDFLDTNVLVYLFDKTEAAKRQRAERLVYGSLESGAGCISFQVVQETMKVITRKYGATPDSAQRFLDGILIPLWQVNPTPSLYRSCLRLDDRYAFGFYDALIVAAALEAGCKRLYTEDMQHGQRIQNLEIHNPFVESS